MNTAEMGFLILKNPYKTSYLIVFEPHRKVGSLFQTDIVLSMWWWWWWWGGGSEQDTLCHQGIELEWAKCTQQFRQVNNNTKQKVNIHYHVTLAICLGKEFPL